MLKETLCADEWSAVQTELDESCDTEVCTKLHMKITAAVHNVRDDMESVSIMLTEDESDEVAAIFSRRGWS